MEEKENKSGYWENKLLIGKGNLKKFAEDHGMINEPDSGMFTVSSTKEVCLGEISTDPEFKMVYEYCIHYKKAPAANKQLNPATGKAQIIVPKKVEEEIVI